MCHDSKSPSFAVVGRRRGRSRRLEDETRAGGDNHRTLDGVAELAHVARPVVVLKRREASFADRVDALAERLRELVDERPHEDRNVLAPFAQRRDGDGIDVEPIVKIFAEGAREPPSRGRDSSRR